MNASTSQSPSNSPSLSTPDVAPSKRNLTFVRPLISCGGALLLGILLIRLVPSTNQSSQTQQTVVAAPIPLVLPASQIVRAHLATFRGAKGATLSGEWKLTTDSTGKATATGEVARWVVSPGSHVEAGDSVVEISTGGTSRPPTSAELLQSKAEQEQVRVAQSQNTLSQKLSAAQTQLAVAQDRVAHAQEKVTAARVLVKRLINGEKIPVEGQPLSKTQRETSLPKVEPSLTRAQTKALSAANEAQNVAANAKDELDTARKALTKAQKQSSLADLALKKAEDDFKAEKTTSDVLQNARADADDASSALKEAQTRVDVADRTYSSRQQQAKITEAAASEARTASQAPPQPTQPSSNDDAGKYMTADEAATLVASALRESKAATRQADRIHSRVEDYQRQVKDSSNRAQDVSQDLQNAQQHVLDSVPRANFVAARAPLSGTITWISRLAREVGVGDSIFGISQGKQGYVRFEDKSQAWKKLRVGQTLNAVSTRPQPTLAAAENSSTMPASNLPGTSAASKEMSAPAASPIFSMRITRISPPTSDGEPAQIDAARADGSGPSDATNTLVQAELPVSALPAVPQMPQARTERPVIIPSSVVLPRNGTSYVAVLTSSTDTARDQTTVSTAESAQEMTLQWRPIEIHSQTAFGIEVDSGLQEGEQIVDQPAMLLAHLKPEEKSSLPVSLDLSE